MHMHAGPVRVNHEIGWHLTIRDLRERTGDLVREAEGGRLSLVTKHGHPVFVAVPLDDDLLRQGVAHSLAVKLFQEGVVSLSRAARVAGVPLEEMARDLSALGIPVVDYPAAELEDELLVLAD